MIRLKRALAILTVLLIIGAAFYLYIPPHAGRIQNMNATLGDTKVDVLCVGSSHVYNGINPIQMYRERGIAAYDLAESSMAPWQSYYYIREACKTQHPKLLIFDTYKVGSVQDENAYQDYQTVISLQSFPFGINKMKALAESKANSRLDILLDFPYSHDDYEGYPGLTTHKSRGIKDYSFGYEYLTGTEPYPDVSDISGITDTVPLMEKNEKYLRMIIEYCRDNDIDLLLTNTPWPDISAYEQRYFNRIGEIAGEYGIPFINGCLYYEDMGIDYKTDCYGDGGHLNYTGVTKYTTFLEDYICEHYNLPDRRKDTEYSVYDEGVKWLDERI